MNISKIHNILSLGISLLFLVVVQRFLVPRPIFRFLIPVFIIFAILVSWYNYWYLKKIQKYNFWVMVRQLLLLTAALGMVLVIPSQFLRGLFFISALILIWVFESFLGNFAENLLISETIITAFGFFFTIMGFGLYIPPFFKAGINVLYIGAIFLAALLTARSFYEFTAQPSAVKWLSATIVGLFCTELFWSLNFLPFHFSVMSFLLINFFYFCLILNYYFLYNSLNLKKIQFHLALMVLTSVLVLLVTPWKIIS